ncbi:MAG: gephyrin-like molybdotransferase Glp [Candidatus Bathyarchaeia archaeon]
MARLKGFQKLTSVDEALRRFLDAVEIRKPKAVSVTLDKALNRVLAEAIVGEEDLPRVDRSAVDGYVVRAEDTFGASQFKPKILALTEHQMVGSNHAKRLWTGNPLPNGANAVVMLENTRQVDSKIEVWTPLAPGENVSKRGEDIRKGVVALEAGVRLRPQHLGLIAALGMDEVRVFEEPKVAILSTGNEIAEAGSERQENQIFDANKHAVYALCRELGVVPIDLGIVRDDLEEIVESLKRGLRADGVITSGGTSVGGSDLVPEAVNKLGGPGVLVHGVAMRPGMPTALAVVDGKPVMVFPGNPVAVMIAFEVFARPLICRMLGLSHDEARPTLETRMTRRIATALGRRTFVRVRVFRKGGEVFAEPVSARGSGLISTMTRSNGYTVVPENREGLEKGEAVLVHLFDVVEEA